MPELAPPRADINDTPFIQSGRIWDDRIGNLLSAARNWRLVALLATAAAIIEAICMTQMYSASNKIIPYIVEVDAQGSVRAVGIVDGAVTYDPTEASRLRFARDYITLLRAISTDPVVVTANYKRAVSLSVETVSQKVQAHLNDHVYPILSQIGIDLDIKDVLEVGTDTYQVTWTEQAWKRGRKVGDLKLYAGIVSLQVKSPTTEREMQENPLGLFISRLNWSQSN